MATGIRIVDLIQQWDPARLDRPTERPNLCRFRSCKWRKFAREVACPNQIGHRLKIAATIPFMKGLSETQIASVLRFLFEKASSRFGEGATPAAEEIMASF